MPSPFPGMDPYLEDPIRWPELHSILIVRMHAVINKALPKKYRAHVDRHVWLEEPSARRRLNKPDVYVTPRGETATEGNGVALIEAPSYGTLPIIEREGPRYLKIIDAESRKVLTIIELLSPSNKKNKKDRTAYIQKRNDCFHAGVNLVEFDLLRDGQRMSMGNPDLADNDYFVFVSAAQDHPKAGIWDFSVRDPIPDIPIPLKDGEKPVMLSLRPCLDQAYDDARYAEDIDYKKPPTAPLRRADAIWARKLLKTKKVVK